MSSPYAGNPASFPVDYLIVDDGDLENASAFNVSSEALGDRTAWLKQRSGQLEQVAIVVPGSSSITAPAGTVGAIVECVGGGGGGGGGHDALTADNQICGGGGGARGEKSISLVPIVPGDVYTVVVGSGGAGGTNGSLGGQGVQGTVSSFTRVTGTVLLARANGGYGGGPGVASALGVNGIVFGPGGTTGNSSALGPDLDSSAVPLFDLFRAQMGQGGPGLSNNNPFGTGSGSDSEGIAGGTAGLPGGADAGSFRAGGPGGGGASGYVGPAGSGAGGIGGYGGPASNVGGVTDSPTPPTAGAGNGAGGGGGGSAGNTAGSGVGTPGAGGGAGYVRILWLRDGLR